MRPAYSSFFVFYVNECTKAGNYGKLFHRNNERMYASLHPSAIAADMLIQVKNLDLYGMGLLNSPLKTTENIDIPVHPLSLVSYRRS